MKLRDYSEREPDEIGRLLSSASDFDDMTSNPILARWLLEGSCVNNSNMDLWYQGRRFIAEAIISDGSLLDVGCANGFLLRCLSEWSAKTIDPYGIDRDAGLINDAKLLYPDRRDSFVNVSIQDVCLDQFPSIHDGFQTIYWCTWDNWKFDDAEHLQSIHRLCSLLNNDGILILGFYDPEEINNKLRYRNIKHSFPEIGPLIANPLGSYEMIAWIFKDG